MYFPHDKHNLDTVADAAVLLPAGAGRTIQAVRKNGGDS